MKPFAAFLLSLLTASPLVGQRPPLHEWGLDLGSPTAMDSLPVVVHEFEDGSWIIAWKAWFGGSFPPGTRIARVSAFGDLEWEVPLPHFREPGPLIFQPTSAGLIGVTIHEGTPMLTTGLVDLDGTWREEKAQFPGDPETGATALPTRDGGALVLSMDSSGQVLASRISSNLQVAWSQRTPLWHALPDRHGLLEMSNGDLLIAGVHMGQFAGRHRLELLRWRADGTSIWRREFPEVDASASPRIVSSGGGLFIAAETDRGGRKGTAFGDVDLWVFRLNDDGNLLWEETVGGASEERVKQFGLSPDGGPILFGWSGSASVSVGSNPETWPMKQAFFAVRFNANGQLAFVTGLTSAGKSVPSPLSPLSVDLVSRALVSEEFEAPIRNGSADAFVDGLDAEFGKTWKLALGPFPEGAFSASVHSALTGGVLVLSHVRGQGNDLHALKLLPRGPSPIELSLVRQARGRTPYGAWTFPTRRDLAYRLETSPNMEKHSWTTLLEFEGDGRPFTFPGLVERSAKRQFFRLQISAPP